ncbi:DUF3616 domain-containing protein [Actinomadura citrea]|uniref:DUF3616 domain-containing protein n=1 Tax=Actinomadura citrea TaxID=46158 RepID=A0A7Y9KCN7_9ACTN|nr:DUF3616 domain-containing protein [Actinomadura citrea]NYE14212.1 hypothetical protein [Actinomadura citrea]GGT80137.1 hypothetical protein GCM10010177_43940 [Actinomadura citrea]
MIVERRVELRFRQESLEAETHVNLSAVRQDGRCLWVAGDETATIERLTAVTGGDGLVTGYGGQVTVALADLVPLPAGPDEEADIEGLARADGWLWAIGSHSLKRKKIKPGNGDAKARKRLATVVREDNRFILARIPLVTGDDGLPRAVAEDGDRTAAVLGLDKDSIADLLADDPHLAPFLPIPSKDNGLDIEGVAVHGDRLYIGLRGPVLRGWAVLVEIRPVPHPRDPRRLRALPVGDDGEPYRTHFLDLGGLGIRDLCPHGDDLLLLTGPSMDLDGPVRLVRWAGAARADAGEIVTADELVVLGELPHGDGDDHAEGIAVLDEPGTRLLVVYDSPAPGRLTADGGVLADVVHLG